MSVCVCMYRHSSLILPFHSHSLSISKSVGNTLSLSLTDTSTNGTFVNGKKVGNGKSALLRGGELIELTACGANAVVSYRVSKVCEREKERGGKGLASEE